MRILLIPLILLGFPALEAVVMVLLAQHIGWWLLAWLLADVAVALALIQQERFALAGRLLDALRQGADPFQALLASGRLVLAGMLLAFPGVISDGLALLALLWPRPGTRAPTGRRDVIEGQFRRED